MKAERSIAQKKKPDSFLDSKRHALAGIRLQPWTPDRAIAAQTLGMLYPNIGKAGWEAVKARNIYPGAIRDVLLALWLCSLDPEQVLDAEARGEADAKQRALEWGKPLGIHDSRKEPFWDAYDLFVKMQEESTDAATVPVDAQTGVEVDDEDDDPGNAEGG